MEGPAALSRFRDVAALVRCAPRWLATPGMSVEKIGMFYEDAAKKAADRRAMYMAEYRRSLTLDRSFRLSSTRRAQVMRRRIIGWLRDTTRRIELER